MIYGYARCSTSEARQDIDRQKRELEARGVDENDIFSEYESGTKKDRPELQRLLATVVPGDTIIATEVSRLSRSTKQLCEILEIVKDRHLKLIIGNFIIDCTASEPDPMTKGMLLMWGVFAEMERDMISERVKSGMENAKAKGKRIGRPAVTKKEIPSAFKKYYKRYLRKELTVSEIAALMGCSRGTVYSYIKIMED